MRVRGRTTLGSLDCIDGANFAANIAQLDVMLRQMQHDRQLDDEYYSAVVQLLTEIKDILKGDKDGS